MDNYLLSLCIEYTQLVDLYNDSSLSNDEIHEIDSQRQVTHNSLCDYVGMDRSENMYQYCKNILHAARAGGYL